MEKTPGAEKVVTDTYNAPHDDDAERALLGALLLGPPDSQDAYQRVSSLPAEAFDDTKHQVIYRAIQTLYAKGTTPDAVTVNAHLTETGNLPAAVGHAYVGKLVDDHGMAAQADEYAAIIRQHYERRELDKALDPANRGTGTPAERRAALRDTLDRLDADAYTDTEAATLKGYQSKFYAELERELTRPRLATPWGSLNKQLRGGFRQGLYLLAAPPGVGKTSLCLQLARSAAIAKFPVAFIALEMPRYHLVERLIDQSGKAPSREKLEMIARYNTLANETGDYLEIHESAPAKRPTVRPWLEHKVRRLMQRHPDKLPLVIVDYLQLLDAPEEWRGDRRNAVGHNAYLLKALSTSANCAVLAVSSIGRASYGKGGEHDETTRNGEAHSDAAELLRSFKESGDLEYAADGALYLKAPTKDENGQPTGSYTLTVVKHRFGPARGHVTLEGDLAAGVFSEARETYRPENYDPHRQ